jgi:hypothetical protein
MKMITKKYNVMESGKASLRFDAKCFGCNFAETFMLELDHLEARSKGGKNSDFVPLCPKCNKRKGNLDASEFYSIEKLAELETRIAKDFSDDEIFAEVARLCYLELNYVERAKQNGTLGVNISEATKRAMAMRNVKTKL